ncbi:putative rap1 GTPase-GDP dissociation stimulator 1-like [Scophthalmus maximus]|uniref:Putative rap1 GTPase-GDP dissociation stimulator 1-like n=1 Tax=Scophthalmus maximus TaxID=52904 RepID=A0A2U9CMZ6_SCOMX|nr:putative rap1 GTPase-GDP dissociation stimulator 1-like [Scophthalmus maximus]
MGHANVPLTRSCHADKRTAGRLQPYTPPGDENLNNALGAIRVLGLELIEHELKPHLNTVLTDIKERKKGAAEQVVISGILPILALSLRSRGPLALPTAKLVAELAGESVVRKGFSDAGLVTALLSALTSPDQELLLHAARAVSRMTYDSSRQQQLLLRRGAVPRLVAVLLRFPDKEPLEEVCLQALCNVSGMCVAEEAGLVWERAASTGPGESVFRGVSPHACGFASSVTLVRVSRWAPGQCAVNIEVFRRCSSSLWSRGGGRRTARRSPLCSLGRCSGLLKLIRFPAASVPRTKSLKTRMFHTFL